jgi:hypothetical protein
MGEVMRVGVLELWLPCLDGLAVLVYAAIGAVVWWGGMGSGGGHCSH